MVTKNKDIGKLLYEIFVATTLYESELRKKGKRKTNFPSSLDIMRLNLAINDLENLDVEIETNENEKMLLN